MSVNKAIILGRLGSDPTLETVSSGAKVCKFSVATSRKLKNGDDKTVWHSVVAWNKTAEACSAYLKKGSQAYIEGEINNRSYEDKDGSVKYISEITATTVQFIGGSSSDNNDSQENNNFQGEDIPF